MDDQKSEGEDRPFPKLEPSLTPPEGVRLEDWLAARLVWAGIMFGDDEVRGDWS